MSHATCGDILALPDHLTGERVAGSLYTSPSTSRRDRMIKAPCYAAHGVDYLWLVDPRGGFVGAFVRDDDKWLWPGTWSDADAKIPPFDAVALDLAAIWALIGGPEAE